MLLLIKCLRIQNILLPKGQIHYFLTKRHKNGLEEAIRKIGKRIYFRLDLFDSWIEKQAKERVEHE